MKKIIKGLKKIFIVIGVFFSFGYTKVFASEVQDMYGIPEPYVLPNTILVFWKLTRSLFISVAFIIGFCIYLSMKGY